LQLQAWRARATLWEVAARQDAKNRAPNVIVPIQGPRKLEEFRTPGEVLKKYTGEGREGLGKRKRRRDMQDPEEEHLNALSCE